MQHSATRLKSSTIASNLVFWYKPNEHNFQAEYEPRGTDKFNVRYFRPQAIDYFSNHDELPEVVIVERDIPRDAVISLVKMLATTGIPLIMHSGKFDPDTKSEAIACCVDDYLFGAIGVEFWQQVRLIQAVKNYANEFSAQSSPIPVIQDGELPAFRHFWVKRSFDIAASLFLLLFLLPIFLLIAIIIRLESRGPIIYISKRAGTGYRIFDFYKFRSMRVNADQELATLNTRNQYTRDGRDVVFFKIKNDPRVTSFGRILRKTSLDELPQLLNVLIGDMSLVGNRPLPLYEAQKLTKDGAAWRFLAPAGITGLWQVKKRGKQNMSIEERIELDADYARNYSVWTDVRILYSTFSAMIQEEKV